MKDIVVVVEGKNIPVKGQNLKVLDTSFISGSGSVSGRLLVVKEGRDNIAVFQKWDYWLSVNAIAEKRLPNPVDE